MISAAQIKAVLEGNAAFSFVGGAGDFASAAEQLKITRSIFIMPPVETAQPNDTGTQVTRQKVIVRLRVVLGFRVRSATKEDQSGDVDTTREALKDALIGWTPNSSIYSPMNYAGSQPLAAAGDGVSVFYASDFFTTYHLRVIPS